MGRPTDATKLPPDEAKRFRDLIRLGKAQYGLTWDDVAEAMEREEKTVRNYMDASHPLPARIAKELLRAVVDAKAATDWRKRHCCAEHASGVATSCLKRGEDGRYAPCDPWYSKASSWWLSRPWVLKPRPFIPAFVATQAIDGLSEELARHICIRCGLPANRRQSVTKAIFSYLNRNGTRLASDAVLFLSDRSEQLANDVRQHGIDAPRDATATQGYELGSLATSFLFEAVRQDWPNLIDERHSTLAPADMDIVMSQKDALLRDKLRPSDEDVL